MYLYSDFIYRICLRAEKLKYLSARRVISDKINMFKNKYAPRFILSRYMRLKKYAFRRQKAAFPLPFRAGIICRPIVEMWAATHMNEGGFSRRFYKIPQNNANFLWINILSGGIYMPPDTL